MYDLCSFELCSCSIIKRYCRVWRWLCQSPLLPPKATCAAGISTASKMETGLCPMLSCDMETWPRSAMWSWWVFSLLFVVRILCESMIIFSWSCFEQEEFNIFVSIVDQWLAPRRSQREPVRIGWFGYFARHRWGSSYLQLSSCIVNEFLILRIIVQNLVHASPLSRGVQFYLLPIDLWLCAECLSTFLTILPAKYVQVLQ